MIEHMSPNLSNPLSQSIPPKRNPLIWLVDDDPDLRSLLSEFLEKHGYESRVFPSGEDVERRLLRERPDLLVLDQMMPGDSGTTICRRIRESGDDVGIIILTARNEPLARIEGIESGADDYIGKPFLPRELVARIGAVLRRRVSRPPGAPMVDTESLSFGPFRIDYSTRTLWRDGERVALTTTEFSLLSGLARHSHRPLTRERLVELLRGPGAETTDRSIDVQISRLRKLLSRDATGPQFIQTVWGYGYVFVPDATDTAP